MEFQEEKATVALGAKRVEVWSPWKPDLEYQDRCVRWIVWRTTEALDGADLKEDDASVSGSVLRCCPEVLLGPGMSRAKVTVQPRWRAHSTGVRFSSSTLSSTSGHSNHCNSRHGLVEATQTVPVTGFSKETNWDMVSLCRDAGTFWLPYTPLVPSSSGLQLEALQQRSASSLLDRALQRSLKASSITPRVVSAPSPD
ncbi:uncharacterized protein isoform X4 [Takifugu rubripes]|uniref:uncharacterized protein isoform X4 n=2 Tax=Takifugu rubripes TaxID=31033 RepID=UPI001145493E|nr:uncharacterized protein LOC105417747 isoform X4 [Takifugu rubripes]